MTPSSFLFYPIGFIRRQITCTSTTSYQTRRQMAGSSVQERNSSNGDHRDGAAKSAEVTSTASVQSTTADTLKKLSLWHLFDPSQPWVLIPNGSLGGHFDWVPREFRVGPWSTAAVVYFVVLWYCAVITGCYLWSQVRDSSKWWWQEAHDTSLQYPPAYSTAWYYHVTGFLWMLFIMYLIMFLSPLSWRAWTTYTVQSWTLLCVRHGVCAATPWIPQYAIPAAEILRFPCAVAHTVTFTVWNFALVPYIIGHVFRHDTVKRRGFIAFCTSFRLTNLHVCNIVLCVLNVGPFGSPRRRLDYFDLYLAAVSAVLYLTWYTCVLDRIGVHLYPIFSPRLRNGFVVLTWSGATILYIAAFHGWRRWLSPLPVQCVPNSAF
jgi:hypothetical protein